MKLIKKYPQTKYALEMMLTYQTTQEIIVVQPQLVVLKESE